MTLNKKYRIAGEVRARYGGGIRKVKWNEVFSTEEEIVEALKEMKIIEENDMPYTPIYTGYLYINSFSKRVKSGMSLTDKQMTQAKRLAVEIMVAKEISIE